METIIDNFIEKQLQICTFSIAPRKLQNRQFPPIFDRRRFEINFLQLLLNKFLNNVFHGENIDKIIDKNIEKILIKHH